MDFRLSEEQRMLHELVLRVGAERHTPLRRREAIANADGFDRALWRELGQLGLLGATLPESCGGLGAGAVAMMLISAGLGRNLVNSPYVPSLVCAASLLAREGDDAQRARHLPPLLAGDSVIAFACAEAADNGYLEALSCRARRVDGGFRLSGRKSLVVGYRWSDSVLVVCKLEDGEELAAFLVPCASPGLGAVHGRTIDGGSASELRLEEVFVPAPQRIGRHDLRAALERVRDEAVVALCADATGSMGMLLEATTEYARTRKQFGKCIGSFQALQHRMVDMLVACEQASSITHQAALKLDADAVQRQLAASAAKALVGRTGRMVAQAAIQIHGGIGITDELAVSHHFRRIEMFNLQSGVVDWHTQRYAGLLDAALPQEAPAA